MQGDVRIDAVVNSPMYVNSLQRAHNVAQKSIKPINVKVNERGLQPLGKMMGSIHRDASEFERSLEASNARVLAFAGSTGVIFGLQRAFRGLLESTIEVEKSMTEIQTLLQTSPKQLQAFGREIFSIAKGTAQSFKSTSEAAAELARQGLDADKTLGRLNSAMILARLSGMEAGKAVDSLTAIIHGFSKELLTSEQIIARLVKVDVGFAVSVGDLSDAVARAGSVAQDAGVNFNELLAIVTSAKQITARSGSEIGNAFRTIFTRMGRGSTLEALEEIGVETRNVNGTTKDSITILKNLTGVYDDLTDVQRAHIAELVGGVFQINILKASLGDLSSEASIYAGALNAANSATNEAVLKNAELNQTIAATGQQLGLSAKQFAATFGEIGLSSGIQSALSEIGGYIESVNNLMGGEGEESGNAFAQGLVKGFGNTLLGPGLLAASAILIKFGVKTLKYMFDSLKGLSGMNSALERQRNLQSAIGTVLQQHGTSYNQLLAQLGTREKVEARILNLLQAQVAAQNNAGISLAGVAANPRFASIGKTINKRRDVQNFADPLQQAIGRETNALRERGLTSAQAKKQIFIGHDPRVGVAVGNLIDEPSGTIGEGIDRERRAGRNPLKAGMHVPSFADSKIGTQLRGETGQFLPHGLTEQINKELAKLEVHGPNTSQGKLARKRLNELSRVLGKTDKRLLASTRRNAEITGAGNSIGGSKKPLSSVADQIGRAKAAGRTVAAQNIRESSQSRYERVVSQRTPDRRPGMNGLTKRQERLIAIDRIKNQNSGYKDFSQKSDRLDNLMALDSQGKIADNFSSSLNKEVEKARVQLGLKQGQILGPPKPGFKEFSQRASSDGLMAGPGQGGGSLSHSESQIQARKDALKRIKLKTQYTGEALTNTEYRTLRKGYEEAFDKEFDSSTKEMKQIRRQVIGSQMRKALALPIQVSDEKLRIKREKTDIIRQRKSDSRMAAISEKAIKTQSLLGGIRSKGIEADAIKGLPNEQEKAMAKDKFADARMKRQQAMSNTGLGLGVALTMGSGLTENKFASSLMMGAGTGAFVGSAIPGIGTLAGAGIGAGIGISKGTIDSMNPDLAKLNEQFEILRGTIQENINAFSSYISVQDQLNTAIKEGDKSGIAILTKELTTSLSNFTDQGMKRRVIESSDGGPDMMNNLRKLEMENQLNASRQQSAAAIPTSLAKMASEFGGVFGISRQSGLIDNKIGEFFTNASLNMVGLGHMGIPNPFSESSLKTIDQKEIETSANLFVGSLDEKQRNKVLETLKNGGSDMDANIRDILEVGGWKTDKIASFFDTLRKDVEKANFQLAAFEGIENIQETEALVENKTKENQGLADKKKEIVDVFNRMSFTDKFRKTAQENIRNLGMRGEERELALSQERLSPQDFLSSSIGLDMKNFEAQQVEKRDSVVNSGRSDVEGFIKDNVSDNNLLNKSLDMLSSGESPDEVMKYLMGEGQEKGGKLKSMLTAFQQNSANSIEEMGAAVENMFEDIKGKVLAMRQQTLKETIGGMDALDVGRRFLKDGNLDFVREQMGTANQLPQISLARQRAEQNGGKAPAKLRLQEAIATEDLFGFWKNIGLSLSEEQQGMLDKARVDVTKSTFMSQAAMPMLKSAGVGGLTQFDPDVMAAVNSGDTGRMRTVADELRNRSDDPFYSNLATTLETIATGMEGIEKLEEPKTLIDEIKSQTTEIVGAIREQYKILETPASSARDDSSAVLEKTIQDKRLAADKEYKQVDAEIEESRKNLESGKARLVETDSQLEDFYARKNELEAQLSRIKIDPFALDPDAEEERVKETKREKREEINEVESGIQEFKNKRGKINNSIIFNKSVIESLEPVAETKRKAAVSLDRDVNLMRGKVYNEKTEKYEDKGSFSNVSQERQNALLKRHSEAKTGFVGGRVAEFGEMRSNADTLAERLRNRYARNENLQEEVNNPSTSQRDRFVANRQLQEDSQNINSDIKRIIQDSGLDFKEGAQELREALTGELGKVGKELAIEYIGKLEVSLSNLSGNLTEEAILGVIKKLEEQLTQLQTKVNNQERNAQGRPAVF